MILSDNRLTGAIPSNLGKLTQLEGLDLSGNYLDGSIPQALDQLTELQVVDLHSNNLSGSIPTTFNQWGNISFLDLNYNRLVATDPILLNFLNLNDPGWDATQTLPPSKVAITAVTQSSLKLTWQPVTYKVHTGYYRTYCGTQSGGPYPLEKTTASKQDTTITLDNLQAGTTYYCIVKTITQAHPAEDQHSPLVSEPSQMVSATTGGTAQIPPTIILPTTSTLSVSTKGEGQGDISFNPLGKDCQHDQCTYDTTAVVQLNVKAAPNSVFIGWGGNSDCADAQVHLNGDKHCQAFFALKQFTLGITKAGQGQGTVTSIPVGIDCGKKCEQDYPINTSITLKATPDKGSIFKQWYGDPDCSDGQVDISQAVKCGATFEIAHYTLTVNKVGSGTIKADVQGLGNTSIQCVPNCVADYPEGKTIQLTAIPDPGFVFSSWSAQCPNGQVTMQTATRCTATFVEQPNPVTPISNQDDGVPNQNPQPLPVVPVTSKPSEDALTAKDIKALTTSQTSQLTGKQVGILPPTAISVFTANQVASLSLNAVKSLTPVQIPFFSNEAVTGFSTNQLLQLDGKAKGAFTAEQRIYMKPFVFSSSNITEILFSSQPYVSKITSKYPDGLYYLEGINHNVVYTTQINWSRYKPNVVKFLTPKGSQSIKTILSTVERQFNMGKDFGTCGGLKAVAISQEGKVSQEKSANFTIMSSPLPGLPSSLSSVLFIRKEQGNHFYYTTGLNLDVLDTIVDRGRIPNFIPIFGKNNLSVNLKLPVNLEITDAGKISIYKKTGSNISLAKINGFQLNLKPSVTVGASFEKDKCKWVFGGSVGALANARFDYSIQIFVPVPVIGVIPINVKVFFAIDANGLLSVKEIKPFKMDVGQFGIKPTAGGSVNLGVDVGIADASVGVWAEGGGDFIWRASPSYDVKLNRAAVFFDAGAQARLYVWLIYDKKWKGKVLDCDWDFLSKRGGCGVSFFRSRNPVYFALMGRDYLNHPHYDTLRRSSQDVGVTPVELSVYPYSEAALSSNGEVLQAAWIVDNPQRNAVNRTMAVFSTWEGDQWREPQAIADDGTADFRPRLLTFENNDALATWEDVKQPLAETAAFEDMIQAMEISVARFDAQTQQWLEAKRLTDNTHLDGNPKLSGPTADDVLITWISNPANALVSSVDAPHQLWFARWEGHDWQTPELVTEIPYPLLGYDMVYDGQKGYVVLTLDTDSDLTTLADRELFLITLDHEGRWSDLTALTADMLIDTNPQLGLDPENNVVLTWLKQDEISSAMNFDLGNRVVIEQDDSGYSNNLDNFKLARSHDGKLAVVWVAPSITYNSDLHALFYDPVNNQWGGLKQLTADPETEGGVAVAFHDADTLVALYNRSDVDLAVMNSDTEEPPEAQTDLYSLRHVMRAEDFTETPAEDLLAPVDHTLSDTEESPALDLSTLNLPELDAIQAETFALDAEGVAIETQALLYGGISVDTGDFKKKIDFDAALEHGDQAQPVMAKGLILPDPKHDGQLADIFVFGEYTPYLSEEIVDDETCPTSGENTLFYLMQSLPKTYVVWDEPRTPKNIPVFLYQDVLLQKDQPLEYTLFEGVFDGRGCLSISFGYRLKESGAVVYNPRTATLENAIGATVRRKPISQ